VTTFRVTTTSSLTDAIAHLQARGRLHPSHTYTNTNTFGPCAFGPCAFGPRAFKHQHLWPLRLWPLRLGPSCSPGGSTAVAHQHDLTMHEKPHYQRFLPNDRCVFQRNTQGTKHPPKNGTRVLGLPTKDCARDCNNHKQMCARLSAIDVTAKTFFDRLYLILWLFQIAPLVNCPYLPTTPTIHCTTISRFLCNFFPRMTEGWEAD